MTNRLEFETLLVPIDFSAASESTFERALQLAEGESAVLILLHVIDPSLVDFVTAHGWGAKDEVTREMRARAERELDVYKSRAESGVEIDVIVSEGVPFLEILRKAEDFAVDAIIIGKVGGRGGVEKLLFGSTAEKVLRGSRRPVIILPVGE